MKKRILGIILISGSSLASIYCPPIITCQYNQVCSFSPNSFSHFYVLNAGMTYGTYNFTGGTNHQDQGGGACNYKLPNTSYIATLSSYEILMPDVSSPGKWILPVNFHPQNWSANCESNNPQECPMIPQSNYKNKFK